MQSMAQRIDAKVDTLFTFPSHSGCAAGAVIGAAATISASDMTISWTPVRTPPCK